MAYDSESTPFLANNNYVDSYNEAESKHTEISSANEPLRRTIAIMTIVRSILSLPCGGILIGSYVLISESSSVYPRSTGRAIQGLCISVSIFILYLSAVRALSVLLQSPLAYILTLGIHRLCPFNINNFPPNPSLYQHGRRFFDVDYNICPFYGGLRDSLVRRCLL